MRQDSLEVLENNAIDFGEASSFAQTLACLQYFIRIAQ